MFTIRRIAIACVVLSGVLLWLKIQFGNPGIGVDVEPRDARLAEQVVRLVESEFRQLPSDHPVIARYGEFKSMAPERTYKIREHELFGNHYPATLEIDCRCEFAKYEAQLDVVIVEGYGPEITVSMDPSPEQVSDSRFVKVPTKRDGKLWYDNGKKEGEDGWGSWPSSIDCRVSHPEFQP